MPPRTPRLLAALGLALSLGACVSAPPMARNLPGDIRQADREFDRRLKARFPVGSASSVMVRALTAEGFEPSHARNADPSTHVYQFERGTFPCSFSWNVFWTSDDADRVADVSGTYDAICL